MATETAQQTVIRTLARVISNDQIIANHKVLWCHAPEIAKLAIPGHFVNILASGVVQSILRKPFSVFQADVTAGDISILYQIRGATTIGMSRKLPGDTLDIVGPLGGRVFNADPNALATHVMVGGGYGVPPLVFLADRIKQANPAALVLFLVGARSRELVMCEAHLQEHGVETRITTEDGSYGEIGRVTDLLDEILVGHKANIKVYTCGPTGMMRTVAEKCLAAKVQCQVSLEVPMPCGIGVCMGCVVDTVDSRRVRACRSGPVFEASELVF